MIKKTIDDKVEIKMDIETEYEAHRFETFFSKEPETISWIKTIFQPNDVFFDIGANIGVYSLYTAAFFKDKIKIFAFEPVYHNFAKLCKNISINKFNEYITPFSLAIGGVTEIDSIKLASTISGSASHIMDESCEADDGFESQFIQGVFSVTLDDLVYVYKLSSPNHIKIDTDGFEENIINGAVRLLNEKSLKSILIEIDNAKGLKKIIEKKLTDAGFCNSCPLNFQKDHSNVRRKANNKDLENIIYTRK